MLHPRISLSRELLLRAMYTQSRSRFPMVRVARSVLVLPLLLACSETRLPTSTPRIGEPLSALAVNLDSSITGFSARVDVSVAFPDLDAPMLRAARNEGSFDLVAMRNPDGTWRLETTRPSASGRRRTVVIPGDGQPAYIVDQFGNKRFIADLASRASGQIPAGKPAVLGPVWHEALVLTPAAAERRHQDSQRRFGLPIEALDGVLTYRKSFTGAGIVAEERFDASGGLPVSSTLIRDGQVISVVRHRYEPFGAGIYYRALTTAERRLKSGIRVVTEHRLSNFRLITAK